MNKNKIEEGNYVGYLWMSNSSTPECWKEPKLFSKELDTNQNPFVIEGMLFDADRQVSYSIKYVDGEYIVHRWNLQEDFPPVDFESTTFHCSAHSRIGGNLLFKRYWHIVPDHACLDMPVLMPYAQVFVGFNNID